MTAQFGDLYHYGGNDFTIIRRKPWDRFDPGKFGLKPDKNYCSACWDGFWCDFAIIDDRLLLKNLHVKTEDDHYPVISGVSIDLQQNRPWDFPVYRNLYIPIPWTGKVLAGNGFLQEYYAHLGYQRIWAYQLLKEFMFKDGNLVEINDLSELGEQLRTLAPKPDPYGLWNCKNTAPMARYTNAWWL